VAADLHQQLHRFGHRGKLVFNSLDDFLSGTIDGGSSASGDGTRYSYQNSSGAYLLDSWRLSERITINYGLRWDYFGVIGAENNAFSIFDVKTGGLETIGAAGGPSSLYPKDWSNFAPRVSVADDLLGNGKLVIRAGGGIFYDGPSQDFFVGNQAYNTMPVRPGRHSTASASLRRQSRRFPRAYRFLAVTRRAAYSPLTRSW